MTAAEANARLKELYKVWFNPAAPAADKAAIEPEIDRLQAVVNGAAAAAKARSRSGRTGYFNSHRRAESDYEETVLDAQGGDALRRGH